MNEGNGKNLQHDEKLYIHMQLDVDASSAIN